MRRVMVFGGSFDPFHFGHVAVINNLLSYCDHLLVVPCGERTDKKLSPPQARLLMLQAGLRLVEPGKSGIVEWEISEGHIYTRVLMNRLRQQYPTDRLFFVIGSDLITDISQNWVMGKELLLESDMAVVQRKGYELKQLPSCFSKDSFILPIADLPELSSTFIRETVQKSKPIAQYLPQEVRRIVEEQKLYID